MEVGAAAQAFFKKGFCSLKYKVSNLFIRWLMCSFMHRVFTALVLSAKFLGVAVSQ